jgi:hypothetical protein
LWIPGDLGVREFFANHQKIGPAQMR